MGFLTGKVLDIYVLLSLILKVQENIQGAFVYYLWKEGERNTAKQFGKPL